MRKRSAFSLIELSIVILIIGILIAGITQSSRLIKQTRLKTARSLTQSSPVAGISDLLLWYETSLESSFDDSVQTDGGIISAWYDNNPQSTSKLNATPTLTVNGVSWTACDNTNGPTFRENIFNLGIPAVRFDGTDDCLNFDGSGLIGNNYTIFVVEQKRAAVDNHRYFFGGISPNTSTNNVNLYFGWATDISVRFTQGASVSAVNLNYNNSSLAYSAPVARIHTGQLDKSVKKSYWLNGGDSPESSNTTSSYTASLVSFDSLALGRFKITSSNFNRYFNGDIAEIIIFTRALKTEERQAIESYLGKKYAITIS